jgi:curved DNA-binding protein CbpA
VSRQLTDYYALLGVARGASAADLGRAYRRAARATHPDVHPDDAVAADRFHAVTIAYETLSDPRRRAAYDHAHPTIRRSTSAPIAVHRRRAAAAPVHLGRRQPQPEPLRPSRNSSMGIQVDDMLELAQAISRFVFGRPFP